MYHLGIVGTPIHVHASLGLTLSRSKLGPMMEHRVSLHFTERVVEGLLLFLRASWLH